MRRHRSATVARLAARDDILPGESLRLAHYRDAFASSDGLKAFADAIPPDEDLEQAVAWRSPETDSFGGTYWSELRRQAQLVVLAFKTGVAVSADLHLGGFDTHRAHDTDHEWLLGNLTDGVDFL